MDAQKQKGRYSFLLVIVLWGSVWGIFEATVGYLLHAVSFAYASFVWYPFACFFMANAYRKTGRASTIIYVGLLCAVIKLMNLLLPGRIDKVLNPAVSIVFEALAMAAAITALKRIRSRGPLIKASIALLMNTCWRGLFALYLLFIVPDWMRTASVIGNTAKFIPFAVTQNLGTGLIVFIGYLLLRHLYKPVAVIEKGLMSLSFRLPDRVTPILKTGAIFLLLCTGAVVELLL